MIEAESINLANSKTVLSQAERRASANGHAWFNETRQAAMSRFGKLGLPTTRHEDWQYTNLAALGKTPFVLAPAGPQPDAACVQDVVLPDSCCRVVLVNGHFRPGLSDLNKLPAGLTVCSLADAFERHRHVLSAHLARHARYQDDALTALNTALLADGAFVHVSKGVVLEQPIEIVLVSASGAEAVMAHPRNVLLLEENSQATVIETYTSVNGSVAFTNAVTEVSVGQNAVLDHYKIERENTGAFHVGSMAITQGRSSNVTSHTITFGGGLVRNNIHAVLDGEGSDCTLNGLTMLAGQQHADVALRVEHAKPRCTSWEYFKGIYDDRSRGVFSGRIYVHKDAQKTDAKQTNMSLLLSDEALADSKPQLEIFADDVKCTHGATIGQVDDNAIFYLRSRGLSQEAARSLLVYAFAGETIGSVRCLSLRRRLQQDVLSRLPQGTLMPEAS
jgi:Fe-S cluster assembly protein SufD